MAAMVLQAVMDSREAIRAICSTLSYHLALCHTHRQPVEAAQAQLEQVESAIRYLVATS